MLLSLAAFLLGSLQTTHEIEIGLNPVKPISRYIYGVNAPGWAGPDFPFTLGRLGGNRMTAYNWETNASNAGSDWHNQNDGFMGASDVPGQTLKEFLKFNESRHAATIITIPTAGYVAADKNTDGDVNKTPNYLKVRFNRSLPAKGSKFVYPPDLQDKVVYQDECVAWLERVKSTNDPLWFMLDNEPDLWGQTHSRIWPKSPTYAQIFANNIAFAKAIKAVDPNTMVFGPANYGWQGFHNFQDASDGNGRDFIDAYLDAMKEAGGSRRILDDLDIHWYPEAQGGGVRVTENTDKPGTAEARIQAPRSLWDPTYVENSWITENLGGKPIVLLPTILGQIERHYPGTKFSISEYNYGGAKNISGAIAQADVLGIFGRYGLEAACNWGIGKDDVGQIAGFKAFINFDGKGGSFGNQELPVKGEAPAETSVYASLDPKNSKRVIIVAINKAKVARPERFKLMLQTPSSVEAYSVTSDHLTSPKNSPASIEQGGFSFEEPPLSVTTIVVILP